MSTNMGGLDRSLRAIVGLMLLYVAYTGMFSNAAWAMWLVYAVGALLLATAAIGWCPPYALFGWNTCNVKK
ncbi:MAG: DUF2892 domain-containing protein [Chitinophagaceae bacterium]|nr:DUF2892 domain-containing protein [Polaromonas sp.]